MPVMIGLIEVRVTPNANLLFGSSGAFVQVVAMAESAEEFIRRARKPLEASGLQVISAQDVALWSTDIAEPDADPELAGLAEDVQRNPDHVRWGTFHTWLDVHA